MLWSEHIVIQYAKCDSICSYAVVVLRLSPGDVEYVLLR
jgi:hypothetical protein